MKHFVVFLLFLCFSLTVKGQSANPTDGCTILFERADLANPLDPARKITLYLDETSLDGKDASSTRDAIRNYYSTGFLFSSIITGTDFYLGRESKPYLDRLYVDFPLFLQLPAETTPTRYSFRIDENVKGPEKAVFVRLMDKENPSVFHCLSSDSNYEFTFQSTTQVAYSDRFVVRIYLSSVLKEGVATKNWMQGTSWYGEIVPGSTIARASTNVIIPESTSVDIPTGNAITVGKLYNSGFVSVETTSSLTIESSLVLDPTKTYY